MGGDDYRPRGIFNQVGGPSSQSGPPGRRDRRGQHFDLSQRSSFYIKLGGEFAREMTSHGTWVESPMIQSFHPPHEDGRECMPSLVSPLAILSQKQVAAHPPLISASKPQSGRRRWVGSLHFKVMARSPSDRPRDLLSWGPGTRRGGRLVRFVPWGVGLRSGTSNNQGEEPEVELNGRVPQCIQLTRNLYVGQAGREA